MSGTASGRHVRPALAALLALALVAPFATPATANDHGACNTAFHAPGGTLYPPASSNATVSGTIGSAPNATVTVTLGFAGDDGAVLRNETTTDEWGDFEATFDLTTFDGRTFVASLRRDGEVLDAAEGRVGVPRASVTFENQTAGAPDGRFDDGVEATVTARRVSLAEGGFVAIHRGSENGPIVGVSDHLQPGTHENVTVGLVETDGGYRTMVAMAHLDSDCDGRFDWVGNTADDPPYQENHSGHVPVADAATVLFPTPTPSPSPTPSPTPDPGVTAGATGDGTPTATPTSSAMPTLGTPTPTATTTPGFAVAATVAALVGAAVVAVRTG